MRLDLVNSAVSFLSSEKVKTADREKKVQFLKQKGLNDEEINEAFTRVVDAKTMIPTAPKIPPRSLSSYHQPVHIVYYPPPPLPRMAWIQMVRYGLGIGLGAFGLTVALTTLIKTIMGKLLGSIAKYQCDRYASHRNALSRIEATLNSFTITSMGEEQERLVGTLNKVVDRLQPSSSSRTDRAYKDTLSCMERFKNTLHNDPLISSLHNKGFSSYSGLAYEDRYKVNTEQHGLVQQIKSDIRSIKGSLLSRRNFPTTTTQVPAATFVPPPPTPVDPNAYHPRNRYQRYTNQ